MCSKLNSCQIWQFIVDFQKQLFINEFIYFSVFVNTILTLYCLLRYFSHGSGLRFRANVTSGLCVSKRIEIPAAKAAPAPMTTTSGINWKMAWKLRIFFYWFRICYYCCCNCFDFVWVCVSKKKKKYWEITSKMIFLVFFSPKFKHFSATIFN